MGEYLNQRAADLSGGQKQRVGIARAFMQEPRLLLCDEPIASLDPASAATIMTMIYTMTKKRGITCLINLHQIDIARRYASRIIGLQKGRIVFDGSPDDLDDQAVNLIYGTKDAPEERRRRA